MENEQIQKVLDEIKSEIKELANLKLMIVKIDYIEKTIEEVKQALEMQSNMYQSMDTQIREFKIKSKDNDIKLASLTERIDELEKNTLQEIRDKIQDIEKAYNVLKRFSFAVFSSVLAFVVKEVLTIILK